MRRILMGFVVVASAAPGASAERTGLFEIVRHEVEGGGTIQLFDGSPPESEFISINDPNDGDIGYGVSDDTGTGQGTSSIGSRGVSRLLQINNPEPFFSIISDLDVNYIGSGPNLPGGTTEGVWRSIVEFVMPVAQAQWFFWFDPDESPGFAQTSSATVENVTTGEILVSTSDPLLIQDIFRAHVGDVIRVSADFAAQGTAPANVSGLYYSGARIVSSLTIPEPGSMVLLSCGGFLCLLTRRPRPR